MLIRLLGILLALQACAVCTGADGPSFAVRAGRVITAAPGDAGVIENGVVLVRDGLIEAVGADLAIPPDLRLVEMPDAVIMPGFVAASSGLTPGHDAEESIGAGYHAADSFDVYGDYRPALGAGVTTVHLNPGDTRLLAGQGAVVKLGGPAADRLLRREADLTITLGESVFNPPPLQNLLIPASADNQIQPPTRQRPASRMEQFLALREAITGSLEGDGGSGLYHDEALAGAWRDARPLRVQADRSQDIAGAVGFLASQGRGGYIVGGAEAAEVADRLRESGTPLVYTVDASLDRPAGNLGDSRRVLERDVADLAKLDGVTLAIGAPTRGAVTDLRLSAARALGAGLSEQRVIEAITRTPAEILGVAHRVGSLEPGKDADFLVLSDHPLRTSSHVLRTYVNGRLVYRAESDSDAVIVRGETVWLGPDEWLENGQILIEDGRITAVGRAVPTPPGARVIDGGPGSFITPGLIDAHGHLGLSGDRASPSPELTLSRLIGVPAESELRVAREGVTTVLLSPYSANRNGSQISAVKTGGAARSDRVVRPTAGVYFDLRGADPRDIEGRLKPRMEAGKKYLESWKKHEEELAAWEKARAEGKELEEDKVEVVEEAPETPKNDPITGRWDGRIFGGPIPAGEEPRGVMAMKLTGDSFEGKVIEPAVPLEHRIVGTLNGTSFSGTIEVDGPFPESPSFQGTLEGEDFATGTISIQGLEVQFEGRRISKEEVQLKVERKKRRTTGKDGRPLPPKVDESLEPIRALLEKRIPAVVDVRSPAQVEAVLDALKPYETPLVLLNAEGAETVADRIVESGAGVVVPANLLRYEDNGWTFQAGDLARLGVPIAMQSSSEDGARTLPLVAMKAVERGLGPEQALAALTVDAAKMFQLGDRVGAIKAGCDGDVVIFDGYPLEASSRVRRVIVGGEEVEQ